MDILQLRYFKTVAEMGSFTRAADSLHMTQSALSRSIAKLEDEIGVRLFERDGNHITLNRFGQRFLHDSSSVIISFSDCVKSVRELAGLEQGDVSVGISRDIFLDHLIRHFLIDYPETSFHCYLLSPEQMYDALQNGGVDFVVTTSPPVDMGVQWQELYLDQLEVMLCREHPLAGEKQIHLDQLKNESFVITNSNYNMDNVIRNLCLQAGFEPKILYEGTSTDMPMYFISHGHAIMITPHSITAGVRQALPIDNGIKSVPLVNEYRDMRKIIRVAFKEGHYLSNASRIFYERMLDFYSGIDQFND